ncbi:MAG: SIMPL domain-containing protein [Candidatus Levyibacteriota bacterium]
MAAILSEIRKPLIIVVVILLGFFLYTKLAGPIPFSVTSVQTTKSNLFSASGTGKVTAAPDIAQVSLGVTQTAGTVAAAQSRLNARANSLIDTLKGLGIEEKDIKTTNYSISPNYDFTAGQRITGYAASQNLEIKTKQTELANRVIDAATGAGANVVGGVTFTFDDETRTELEGEARKDAVGEAKRKANSLADAAGIRLGRIIDVQESFAGQPIPLAQLDRAVGTGSEPTDTNITPGENTIEITVTLSFETL